MTEHLMVAIWRAAAVSPEAVGAAVLDRWAPEALADENVEECVVSFAEPDQGIYSRRPDAQGLVPELRRARSRSASRAPTTSMTFPNATCCIRSRAAWRCGGSTPVVRSRGNATWADGEFAPGVKMVSFMQRADAITHEQFVQHWTEHHTPLALRHHVGLWNYTQNIVRRSFTPGGNPHRRHRRAPLPHPGRFRLPLLRLRRRPRRDPRRRRQVHVPPAPRNRPHARAPPQNLIKLAWISATTSLISTPVRII